MAISLRHKFIFIHCEKTGGTSIKQWLQKALHEPLENWQHFRIGDVRQMIDKGAFRRFFKFSFVRNPWDRVVSNYHFCRSPMFRGVDAKKHQIFSDLSFKEHVRKRVFLCPQCACLYDSDGNYLMDFVGRYENLEKDVSYVARRLFVDPPNDSNFPWKNRTSHGHYSSYYDDKTRGIVAKFYQSDIKRFKYRFETC